MKYFIIIFCIYNITIAQNINLIGQVKTSDNQILEGANVFVQGTTLGATTDKNGHYLIVNIPTGSYTLIASFIGFAEKKLFVKLKGDTTLNIKLTQNILEGPIVSTIATRAKSRESAVSFSSISKLELENRRTTQDIPELLADLPSTTFFSEGGNGLGYSYLSIRGFEQRRISVLINGIPQNDPEEHNVYWTNFPDLSENIESIQVQRGAGNAFYGPAAIGGSINIKTDPFSPVAKIKALFGYGSFNTKRVLFSANSGLLNNNYILYGRVSNIKSDGYRDNAWIDFWSYFLGAAAYFGNSNLRLHFYGGPVKDGLAYIGIPKSYNNSEKKRKINFTPNDVENFNQPHFEVLHEWQIADNLIMNNNLFYIKGYGYFDLDGSWGTSEFYRLTPEYGYDLANISFSDAVYRANVEKDQVGWLPQLTIKSIKGDLILGAELRYHRSNNWGRLQKGSEIPEELLGAGARRFYQFKGGKDIASVYFHQNYKWFKNVNLQADLQYSFKQYHFFDEKFRNNDFTVAYTSLNPSIGINYNMSAYTNLYFNIYNTQREPNLLNLYNAGLSDWAAPQFKLKSDNSYNFNKPLVKPESLSGLELGAGFKDSKMNAVLNLYYMDFVNEIVANGGLDQFGNPNTGNAKQTRHYGIEFDGRITLSPQLSLSGNINASKNEFLSYTFYQSDTSQIDLAGNPIAGFPNLLSNIQLAYNWQGLYVSLSGKYVGEFYTDNFKNKKNKINAHTIFDLTSSTNLKRIGLPQATIKLRINNLLDKKFLAYGIDDLFYPAAGRNFFTSLQFEY